MVLDQNPGYPDGTHNWVMDVNGWVFFQIYPNMLYIYI